MAAPLTTFDRFDSLPMEIRCQIWKHAAPKPRLISIAFSWDKYAFESTATPPVLLAVNKEARAEVMRTHVPAFHRTRENENAAHVPSKTPIYVNFATDVVQFKPNKGRRDYESDYWLLATVCRVSIADLGKIQTMALNWMLSQSRPANTGRDAWNKRWAITHSLRTLATFGYFIRHMTSLKIITTRLRGDIIGNMPKCWRRKGDDGTRKYARKERRRRSEIRATLDTMAGIIVAGEHSEDAESRSRTQQDRAERAISRAMRNLGLPYGVTATVRLVDTELVNLHHSLKKENPWLFRNAFSLR